MKYHLTFQVLLGASDPHHDKPLGLENSVIRVTTVTDYHLTIKSCSLTNFSLITSNLDESGR